jgi:hypothetical protein
MGWYGEYVWVGTVGMYGLVWYVWVGMVCMGWYGMYGLVWYVWVGIVGMYGLVLWVCEVEMKRVSR